MSEKNKRGQVTLFIIVAIVIVFVVVAIMFFNGWFKFDESPSKSKEYIEVVYLIRFKK